MLGEKKNLIGFLNDSITLCDDLIESLVVVSNTIDINNVVGYLNIQIKTLKSNNEVFDNTEFSYDLSEIKEMSVESEISEKDFLNFIEKVKNEVTKYKEFLRVSINK
ncbi:MAG: hypothetical protein HRU03_07310 [Nanoarchaeales archaeon]|nr:hypothetical protein [Nanoarchaeales archaeon]